jgi:hypothetical protein
MRGRLEPGERGRWETFLTSLGAECGATIQLAEVVGKRWHYLAGNTDSEAGLLGMFRLEVGGGYGVLVFPHEPSLPESVRDRILQAVGERLRQE